MLLSVWFDHFLDSRAEILQFLGWFFGKVKTPKSHSEINWPLTAYCPDIYTVAKVIGGLAKWGVHHKNVVARTTCGRLLADISRELG